MIATTGNKNSMKETEEHYIAAVSADNRTLTLKEPLKYRHISIVQTFGGREVETRGEVALLTRNVVVQGSLNEEFLEVLPACDQEFNSGGAMSDALQTCFSGKFGEELGSDEMGAVIIISPPVKDQGLVEARIEYAEFRFVGQAFRVGRYPIHFHLPGNMNTSYVRGNAIHHSFNRACTLHDVANLLVEHNVAYNIKGLTFFLEDGVEMHNTLQYNLAVFTRMSNSLLNPDINPASFWIVNPNNKFLHNACAGGTHVCFWLRPATRPDGPSYTRYFCPNQVPFDEFRNNSAHSMGWYGFWIFGQSNHATYDPHTGTASRGYCNGYRTQAKIGSFTTWNNKKGFEIVSGANIRMENQTHMDHSCFAYEIFSARGPYGDGGPGIYNSLVVGRSKVSDLIDGRSSDYCTPVGIAATSEGYNLKNIKFYNFGPNCVAIKARLDKSIIDVSLAIRTEELEFTNTTTKVLMDKASEQGTWFKDYDGTLTGTVNSSLVTKSGINPPDSCTPADDSLGKGQNDQGLEGVICNSDVQFHRMTVSNVAPSSLKYTKMTTKNEHGEAKRSWLPLPQIYAALIPQMDTPTWISFDSVEHITNISYNYKVTGMHPGRNFLILGHQLYQHPDKIRVLQGVEHSNYSDGQTAPLAFDNTVNGDWRIVINNITEKTNATYILSSKGDQGRTNSLRRKRDTTVATTVTGDVGVWPKNQMASGQFQVIRCEAAGCIPTAPPTAPTSRPENPWLWSNSSFWEVYLNSTVPETNAVVNIPGHVWLVLDVNPPPLKRINIFGVLEVLDNSSLTLEAEIIFIYGGGFIVGYENDTFKHDFTLKLNGNHLTDDQPMYQAPNLGAKAIGAYGYDARGVSIPGYISMHGQDVGITWTKIASTAQAGSNTIELSQEVSWAEGSEIVVSSTSWELKETERHTILSVAGKTITINGTLMYTHMGTTGQLSDNSLSFKVQGEVGLLTRNVKIVGAEYEEIEKQQFGARVLIGAFNKDGAIFPSYGRFSNVEFARVGQDGWTDFYDPRYSLVFHGSGNHTDESEDDRPPISYVKKCAFNYNYNNVIGLFESHGVTVEDNVVYRFFQSGIRDESQGTKIVRNLVTMGESIEERKGKSTAVEFFGCIDIQRAHAPILIGNVAAGCAQAGILTRGSPCHLDYTWADNEVHTSQHGVHLENRFLIVPGHTVEQEKCVQIKNVYSWRNYDYGLNTLTPAITKISNMILVDNGVGIMTHNVNQDAEKHEYVDGMKVTVENSTIVGASNVFDCDNDEKPEIMNFSPEKKRSWSERGQKGDKYLHHTGMVFPIFLSKYQKDDMGWHVPLKSAAGSSPALRGIMEVKNVTFANFNNKCKKENGQDKIDVSIRTNKKQDDMNFPMLVQNLKFVDVLEGNKVSYNRPIPGKISPADCADFDCDGMKKALIIDNDGSLIGDGPGTVIPDSAYEWDGVSSRGLGYYRVPKPMVTRLNGSKISYGEKMPNTGIFRTENCTWVPEWTAYKCYGINHRVMIIESMDRDKKIRRLSPIAVLTNPGENGYIDLVNGPQDHSCCSGYTCSERLSTFYTIVALGHTHEIVLTSIPPQDFRIHLLHMKDTKGAVLLQMWFPKQQRYDVYKDGRFVEPNNKNFSDVDTLSFLKPDDSFIPKLNETNCNHFFDSRTGHLYILTNGSEPCDVKTAAVVVFKLGLTVPIGEFFNPETVVDNIAGVLGIPKNKIRFTDVVREGSTSGRRKRNTAEKVEVKFEVADQPDDQLNSTKESKEEKHSEMSKVIGNFTEKIQTGELASALNLTVSGASNTALPALPKDPPPAADSQNRTSIPEDGLTYAERQKQEDEETLRQMTEERTIEKPENLVLGRGVEDAQEMAPMANYPYLYFTTSNGSVIKIIGGEQDPWIVTVSLVRGPGNVTGNLSVPVVDGMANFTNLRFTKEGSGYQVKFVLTYPTTISFDPVLSNNFSVASRPLKVQFGAFDGLVMSKEVVNFTMDIWDEALNQTAAGEVLANQTWFCEIMFFYTVQNVTIGGAKDKNLPAG